MKKVYPDKIYQALLQHKYKPEISAEKNKEILAAMDTCLHETQERSPRENFFRPGRLIPVISFAIIFIIVVAGWLGSYLRSPLPGKIVVTRAGDSAYRMMLQKPGTIISSPGEELTLQREGETITLLPQTELALKAGGRLFAPAAGIHYSLGEGIIVVKHNFSGRKGDFRLTTPLGTIEVLGTVFMAGYSGGTLRLACREGCLRFYSSRADISIILSAGEFYSLKQLTGTYKEEYHAVGLFATFLKAEEESPQVAPSPLPTAETTTPPAAHTQLQATPRQLPPTSKLSELWYTGVDEKNYQYLLTGSTCLVLGSEKTLLCYDLVDGRQKGKWTAESEILSLDLFLDTAYLYIAGNKLQALDLQQAAILWQQTTGPLAFGAITATEKLVYVPSTDGYLYIYNREDGITAGRIDAGSGLYGKPLADNGRVIFTTLSQQVLCYSVAEKAPVWTAAGAAKFIGDRPVLHRPSRSIILQDKNNQLYIIDADSGRIAFTSGTKDITHFAAAANNLYLAKTDKLSALSYTGIELYKVPWSDEIQYLITASESGLIACTAAGLNLMDLSFTARQFLPVSSLLICRDEKYIYHLTNTYNLYKREVLP